MDVMFWIILLSPANPREAICPPVPNIVLMPILPPKVSFPCSRSLNRADRSDRQMNIQPYWCRLRFTLWAIILLPVPEAGSIFVSFRASTASPRFYMLLFPLPPQTGSHRHRLVLSQIKPCTARLPWVSGWAIRNPQKPSVLRGPWALRHIMPEHKREQQGPCPAVLS